MTKIQNPKPNHNSNRSRQFWSLRFRIWNFFDPILRLGGACVLDFCPEGHSLDYQHATHNGAVHASTQSLHLSDSRPDQVPRHRR
jgi:hypothetical protein